MDSLFDRRPPTALELFIRNPLLYVAQIVYRLRANRIQPYASSATPIRVVCISDTHSHHDRVPPLPDGDILIHAGDLTHSGGATEVHAALQWLSEQSHPHKLFIAGNHDRALSEPDTRTALLSAFPNIIYLEQASVDLTILGRTLHCYGSPPTPKHGSWPFQYPRQHADWSGIPPQTDILVTHGPPAHHLDLHGAGCGALLAATWRVRPRLHVCGHIHAARGVERLDWSEAQAAYE